MLSNTTSDETQWGENTGNEKLSGRRSGAAAMWMVENSFLSQLVCLQVIRFPFYFSSFDELKSIQWVFCYLLCERLHRQSDHFSSFIMLETIEKAPENFLWFDLNIWTLGCIRTSFHSTSSVETAEWNVVKMLVRSQSACRILIMSWDTCGLELSVYIFSTLILCLFISVIVKSKWMRRLR